MINLPIPHPEMVGAEPWVTYERAEDGTLTATFHVIKPLGAPPPQEDTDGESE